MSLFQRVICAMVPRAWAESMQADSRTWMVRCRHCGFGRSLWDLGGIRWKQRGRPRTYTFLKCPRCGRRSCHAVKRDASPGPSATVP